MKNYLIRLAAVVCVLAVVATDASAGGCDSPFCQGGHGGLGLGLFRKTPVPAFQAAPWYLYWPYNAHFMTPAPLHGAYYGAPYGGGAMVNPYFPAAGAPGVAP